MRPPRHEPSSDLIPFGLFTNLAFEVLDESVRDIDLLSVLVTLSLVEPQVHPGYLIEIFVDELE